MPGEDVGGKPLAKGTEVSGEEEEQSEVSGWKEGRLQSDIVGALDV